MIPTRLHRHAKGLAAALIAALVLGACGGDENGEGAERSHRPVPVEEVLVDGRPDPGVLAEEQFLVRGNGEEPQTLDPHLAEGVPSSHILRDLFEGLTTEAPDGHIIPGAAQRWNISADGLVYTFYLRRDGAWSNGDALVAEDFVFSIRRSADPATASNYATMLYPIVNAREVLAGALPPEELGVTSLDRFTLQITLTDPTPYFLNLLAHSSLYPVHRPSLEQYGDRFSRPGNLVSNGAFMLEDWAIRAYIDLVKNPYYHGADEVILEQVRYLPIEDQSTELKTFRAGEMHWTYDVPNNQFGWLRENYPNELVVSPWLGSYFFGFNTQREPFIDSPDLRRALTLAIDREVLTEKVTQFGELPSFNLVPAGVTDYEQSIPEYAAWTQEEREAEAQRLYAQAGYTAEQPLRIEIRYNTSENHKKVALAIASMWKQVLGAVATLVNEEWKVFLQNRDQQVVTQVFRAGWIGDYNDPYSFLSLFETNHGLNDYGYSNSTVDTLLEEIAKERIPGRRRRMMQETERIILEDQPILPVYTYVTRRLVDARLRGWQDNVMDHHYSRSMYLLKARDTSKPARASEEGE